MIKKIYFLAFVMLISLSCNKKIFYGKEHRQWKEKPSPDSLERVHSVYLIGDVGAPFNKESNLNSLANIIHKDTLSSIVFLGDNIYQRGMPPEDHEDRAEAEKIIDRQLKIVEDYRGKVFFIPGNHDWENSGEEGLIYLREQEQYIEEKLNKGNTFVPDNGCPGPLRVSVSDEVVLIFLDTQWWLHKHDKPYGRSSECEAATENEVIIQLRDIIEKNKGRHILITSHHPLFSNGNHGGYYNALDHFFPLRLIRNKWYMYIPLPALGSLYPLFRKFGGSEQDLPSYEYQSMKKQLMDVFKEYDEIVYASGHDHNLQYHQFGDFHHIVSGSGCKVNPVRTGGDASFIQKNYGFSRINYYSNGEAWVEFLALNESTGETEITFRSPLYKKFEISPESYCSLSRLDYSDSSVTTIASSQYHANERREKLLGNHYRDAWSAPVTVPVLDMATEKGGIIPYSIGGGRQSVSLKFKNPDDQEYVARTVEKDPKLDHIIPEELLKTFVDDVIQDQISAQHPYGALTVPPMATAINVLHPRPKLMYIPADSCLGPYYNKFSNKLVLFEEDSDEAHIDAPNLGNSENIVGTEKLEEHLRKDNDNKIDHHALARARLLDMLLGDWDRHEGQFRWAEFKKEGKGEIFIPVPEDRDQVYFKFDGAFPYLASRRWAARNLQNFEEDFTDIKGLNFSAKKIDRRFLSELSEEEWIAIADTVKQKLTDEIIEYAIRQLPDTTFELHGREIIKNLKSRRNQLPQAAREYYHILAKYVNIYGSDKHEYFQIERLDDEKMKVSIFKMKKDGDIKKKLFERTFKTKETKEVRLYGFDGEDKFQFEGKVKNGIVVRVIGGEGTDTIIDNSSVTGLKDHTVVYDTEEGTYLNDNKEINNKLSDDPDVNDLDQDQFFYNYTGPLADFDFNQGDGFFIGAGVAYRGYKFRANPYGSHHRFITSFASVTSSWKIRYTADYRKVIRKTDLGIHAEAYLPYFAMNYFGYGNESTPPVRDIDFYRVRMKYGIFNPTFIRRITTFLEAGIGPKYEYYELVGRENSLVNRLFDNSNQDYFEGQHYAGVRGFFKLGGTDNVVNPTRGIVLRGEASANQQINQNHRFFTHMSSDFSFYLTPNLPWQLTLAGRVGAMMNTGEFTFYQANQLGGIQNLRGFYRSRFVGDKAFYQNLELRSELFKVNSYILAGKFGIAAFIDNGRVWPGEGGYHSGYGGGIWFNFINRFLLSTYYGISDEDARVTFNFGFFF